jgi:hypothetical protein
MTATPVGFTAWIVATIPPTLSQLERFLFFSEAQLVYVNSCVCCIGSVARKTRVVKEMADCFVDI